MAHLSAQVPTVEGTSWVPAFTGSVPEGALVGGMDSGVDLYVARSEHNGALIPGKLIPSHSATYVAWGGEEHSKESYEVLVVPAHAVTWVASNGGVVLPNAIPGGISEDGEIVYIGRAPHEGTITVGKVHPSHGVLYIPYGGKEVAYPDYEILVTAGPINTNIFSANDYI